MASQGVFKGKAFYGMTAAQIQGDLLAGYDKIGMTGGVGVYYPVGEIWDVGVEVLYSEKGSRAELLFDVPQNIRRTHISSFELPVVIQINEWYQERDDYYKLAGHVGLSNAFLLTADSSLTDLNEDLIDAGSFSDYELLFVIGGHFNFTQRIGFNARYSRSLTKFYKSEFVNTGGFLNYYWSVRLEYNF